MDESFKPVSGNIQTETKLASCETHGDFTSTAWKFGNRVMHWSSCPQCGAQQEVERKISEAKAEAEAKQKRLETRLNHAGIPMRYRAKDFTSYIADTDGKEKALSTAMEFVGNFKKHSENGTVVVFSGKPGTGKSHLAISIAQEVMKDSTAFYTSAIDAVRMIRNTWRRDAEQTESQVLETLTTVDLLILDEVGVQYGTESEQVTLFDIIDKRYRDLKPLILLTNLNKAGMKAFLGDRSFDRLREGGIWVTFDWDSGRAKAAA